MPDAFALEIIRIGAAGDGVAERDGRPVYVPFALPGEIWREVPGGGFERLNDTGERVPAPCPHFGSCGGCVAQHMPDALYALWKQGLVHQALAHQGIEALIKPMWRAPVGSRRRVVLSAEGSGGDIRLGFRVSGSHELVAITTCTIAAAEIVAALPVIREILALAAGARTVADETRVHVLRADNGIDVLVEGFEGTLGATVREQLAGTADRAGIVRLSIGRDEIYQSAQPILEVGGADIRVPGGVFMQAVGAAEAEMARIMLPALAKAKRVADLFCGLGTFTLPLAKRAHVLAVDSDARAAGALGEAVRHVQGLKPIEVLRRDLFREPLSRTELKAFDGVVFDPPRAGARAQAEALARSKVPVVVAVSCNPATMARDLRVLIDGGYILESVTPIDQFLYSAHIEAVAVLRR